VPTLTELILKETDEKLFRVISHFFGPKLLLYLSKRKCDTNEEYAR
jgi:hypothetical protein